MTDEPIRPIPVSSKELYEAYVAWRDQDVNDGSEEATDKKTCGLCFWMDVHSISLKELTPSLRSQFKDQVGGSLFPFNASYSDYVCEISRKVAHLNPARIKWVSDRIAGYEKEHGL